MASEVYKEPAQVIRLWVHECERVLADRMISQADLSKFMDMRLKATRKYFPEVPEVNLLSTEALHCLDDGILAEINSLILVSMQTEQHRHVQESSKASSDRIELCIAAMKSQEDVD